MSVNTSEHDLSLPPPRRARLRRLNTALLGVILAVFVGIMMAMYPAYLAISDHTFRTQGRLTTGRVVDLQGWSHDIQDTEWEIYYTYPEMPSTKKYVQDNTDKKTWESLEIGRTIPITYLPDSPGKSRFGRPQDMIFARHFRIEPRLLILSMLVSAFMIIAGIVCLLQSRKHLHLVRQGTAVKGRITTLKATNTGYVTTYSAHYEFTGPDGVLRKGKNDADRKVFETLHEGQEVTILYDPANPKRHGAYPLMSAEVVPGLYQAAVPTPSPVVEAPPAGQGQAEGDEPQTFEQWREAVLAEYGTQLNLGRDQTLAYLARRPYPAKIMIAGVLVAIMVVYALAQTPKYFDAAVHFQRAQLLYKAQRYGESIDELKIIRAAGVKSPKEEYLYGTALLTIGETHEAAQILDPLTFNTRQEAELGAILDQIKASKPYWKAAREHMDRTDSGPEVQDHLEKTLKAWPTFTSARLILASAYASQYTRTLDERLAAKYASELALLRKYDPSSVGLLEKTFGDLKDYKPAEMLFRKAELLRNARNYDEAMKLYHEAIGKYPQHARAHAFLAVTCARKYEATGDTKYKDECLKEYRTAVSINPRRAGVKPQLGALAKEVDAK